MSEEKRTFKFTSKASKEAAQKQKEKGGYAYKSFKMKGDKARLLILPPVDDKEAVFFKVTKHQVWGMKDGKKSVIAEAASPQAFGEKDKLMQLGFKIRNKFLKSKNEKLKIAWRNWMPKDQYYVNVLDLDNIEAGPQVYLVPGSVFKTINSEFEDVDWNLEEICDFSSGKVLQIKSNGLEGLKREYDSKFLSLSVEQFLDKLGKELTDKDIEEIANKVYSLSKLQPKFNEEDFERVESALEKFAQKIGLDIDSSDDSEEEDDEEVPSKSKKSNDEDDEDLDEDISDLDEDEEEAPKSKSKKSKEVDEDEEEFDLEDEEEEPAPKKKAGRR